MVERCSGYSTVDAFLPSHIIMVRDCVVEGSKCIVPPSMDTVDLVLVGARWRTV